MASTLTIISSINFVRPILKMQPVDVSNQEPALTAGNIILQTMLGPPMRWRFNRGTFSFSTVVTTPVTTDYTEAVTDLGWIEDAWILDSSGEINSLEVKLSLPVVGDKGRPTQLSPQLDDGAGNITFRLKNGPGEIHTVTGNYQRKAALLTSFGSPWAPVPDEFSYIFNLGFLALTSLLVNDARFPIFEQWFISRLLGAQDGLTEQERAIFLGNWTATIQTLTRAQGAVNSGVSARTK